LAVSRRESSLSECVAGGREEKTLPVMMWASTDDVVPPTETYDFSAETINELTTYGMPASAFPPHAIPCTMRTWSLHLQRALRIEAFQADILLKVKHCFHMYIVVRLSFVMINGVQQKF
jgi:hypothetical protein